MLSFVVYRYDRMYIDGRQIRRQNKTEKCRGIWIECFKTATWVITTVDQEQKTSVLPEGAGHYF